MMDYAASLENRVENLNLYLNSIIEYELIQLHIRCSRLEDDMKKLREEVKGNE